MFDRFLMLASMNEVAVFRGCHQVAIADVPTWQQTLTAQYRAIDASGQGNRPWLYWELHNPWSRAATLVDSWALLDICESSQIVDRLAERIGQDIVLFDSQIVPNPALTESDRPQWRNDVVFFPLDVVGGIVVRIPFGSEENRIFEYRTGATTQCIRNDSNSVLLHGADLEYRTSSDGGKMPLEYVIRFFEATRPYMRDPAHPRHIQLTNRYPWVNYARMPLWLVRGEDHAGNDFVTGFGMQPGSWTLARSITTTANG